MKSSTSSLIKGKRRSNAFVADWNPIEFIGTTPAEAEELQMLAEGVTEKDGWVGHEHHLGSSWKSAEGRTLTAEEDEAAAESLRGVVKALIQKKNRHLESITSVFFKSNEINAETFVWPTLEMLSPAVVEEPAPFDFAPEVETEPEVDFEAIHAEAQQILEDARQQANIAAAEISSQARFESENILQQARAQSEEIILAAHSRESAVTQQAHQQGLQAAHEQATLLLNNMQNIIAESQAWHERMLENSETEIVALLKEIAQSLFGSGLALTEEMLSQAFNQAVQEAKPLGNLRIRLNPQDLEVLGPLWAQQQSSLKGIHVELVASETILRGGCIVEGDYGVLDGRVDARLERVLEKITEAQTIVTESQELPRVEDPFSTNVAPPSAAPVAPFEEGSAESFEIGSNEDQEETEAPGEDGVIDLSSAYDEGGPTG